MWINHNDRHEGNLVFAPTGFNDKNDVYLIDNEDSLCSINAELPSEENWHNFPNVIRIIGYAENVVKQEVLTFAQKIISLPKDSIVAVVEEFRSECGDLLTSTQGRFIPNFLEARKTVLVEHIETLYTKGELRR